MDRPERPAVPGPGVPTDEELVRQARGGSRDSNAALLDRWSDSLNRFAGWWARKQGLRAEEVKEVRQEAMLGFFLAVANYAEDRGKGSGPACFRAFMNRVVRNHLNNWDRQRRRAESRCDRSVDWAEELERRAAQAPKQTVGAAPPDTRTADPVDVILWLEIRVRLAAAVESLDARYRWLWDRLAAGRSLHDIADESGLSYDRVKRMCRRMVAQLRKALL
jgi:RNA polymerase sigma factor (sigma-70 family)